MAIACSETICRSYYSFGEYDCRNNKESRAAAIKL